MCASRVAFSGYAVTSVAFGYSSVILAGGANGEVSCWRPVYDWEQHIFTDILPLGSVLGHANSITSMVYAGGSLYSGSKDTTIIQWSIPSLRFEAVEGDPVCKGLKTSEDIIRFAKNISEDNLMYFKLIMEPAKGFAGHTDAISCLCASEDVLITGDQSGGLVIRAPKVFTENVHLMSLEDEAKESPHTSKSKAR